MTGNKSFIAICSSLAFFLYNLNSVGIPTNYSTNQWNSNDYIFQSLDLEAATRSVLWKRSCRSATLLKGYSNTGVLLRTLQNFKNIYSEEHLGTAAYAELIESLQKFLMMLISKLENSNCNASFLWTKLEIIFFLFHFTLGKTKYYIK